MDLTLKTLEPAQWTADALIVPLFETEPDRDAPSTQLSSQFSPELKQAAPWLTTHPALVDATGKSGELFTLHGPANALVSRVLLTGLGRRNRLNGEAACLKALRSTASDAARHCREAHFTHIAASLPDLAGLVSVADTVRETCCGALLGLYRQTAFKSDAAATLAKTPDPATFTIFSATTLGADLQQALREAVASAKAVNLAKDLINAPGNRLTPQDLATKAQNVSKSHPDMRCTVLDEKALAAEGMNTILAVGAGSSHPPRLIILEYTPHAQAQDKPLVFVGKGITFDSGGISLKPSAGMERMKGDMAGAAAVLALFSALAELAPACRVVGLLTCAENMPDGLATRPGDVITTLSGKTVEIVNTDAEGRLVLCDALTYAQKNWQPAALIDVATLTGACAVALGTDMAGLFSREPLLTERLRGLGERVGEPLWPLPLHDIYFEKLKSETADFTNCGPREGGACIAAIFLAQFIEEHTRWAHLDIAGTSFSEKKGGTGYTVRTFIDLCLAGLPRP